MIIQDQDGGGSRGWRALCVLVVALSLVLVSLQAAAPAVRWAEGVAGVRTLVVAPAASGQPGFDRLPGGVTGVLFTNLLSDHRSITNRNLLSGSGVAAGDVNGDGWVDLFFCGLDSSNRLYLNQGGWRFIDGTEAAGLGMRPQDSTASAFVDLDGDGDLDLLVASLGGGVRLFQNDSRGFFRDVTAEAGLGSRAGSMALAVADVEGDGDLDLYVANFRPSTIRDMPQTKFLVNMVDGVPVISAVNGVPASHPDLTNRFVVAPSGTVMELGEADQLYLNEGSGRFKPVSFTGGAFLDEDGKPLKEAPRDWGLAVQFHDFTGDGLPDIYVCNDLFTPDRIWINQGKGVFRAIARHALRNMSTFSMGVDFADVDRDGDVDFFVVDMLSREHAKRHVQVSEMPPTRQQPGVFNNRPQFLRNVFQANRGDGTFAEIAYFAGVEASDWSWGPVFLDVDLDGFEDILVTNGQWRDFQNIDMANRIESLRTTQRLTGEEIANLLKLYPKLETPNVAYRNEGGLRFKDVSAAWGFDVPGISQGMALADLDNDGDMDVVINNLNGEAGVFRNRAEARRLGVRLKGMGTNTRGVGARLRVTGARVVQTQEMIGAGRYLSSDDPMRVFAAGEGVHTVEVTWRSGAVTTFSNLVGNAIHELAEPAGSGAGTAGPTRSGVQAWFTDVTEGLGHRHGDEAFDDYARQPLLPMALSQLGPGVAWHDVDGDGWEDLAVGGGRGSRFAVLKNLQGRGWLVMTNAPLLRTVARDQTGVIGIGQTLLVGSSNYEDGLTNGGCLRVYDLRANGGGESVLGQRFSTGPLAVADVDGDGDLDMFVGGRCVAGRYPEPADSVYLRNEGGRFVSAQRMERLGLVSGATFSDLDGDGKPELVLAMDLGPVRVFALGPQGWVETTGRWGLADRTGWWNGVAAGDFDGDGRMDLLVSNRGLNSRHRVSPTRPWVLRYGDLDGNGVVDIVESQFEPTLGKEVPDRVFRTVGMAIPEVSQRVATHEMYARSSVEEILGELLKESVRLEVREAASMVLLNRGGRFEFRVLPAEAQWSPAFGISVGDADGDGHEDAFLAQNFFQEHPEVSRSDAGRGLWLRGDGRGGLVPLSGEVSGVAVYGEQRACALADFDADGRVDLVVTQNAGPTRLFRNQAARPGVRVRLKGASPANITGVGAQIRLVYGDDTMGPVRELHAGSGYWSQEGAVQVLGLGGRLKAVWVRWPGGATATLPVEGNPGEVEISETGGLKVIR